MKRHPRSTPRHLSSTSVAVTLDGKKTSKLSLRDTQLLVDCSNLFRRILRPTNSSITILVNVESYKLQAQRFVRILSVMRFLADGVTAFEGEEDGDQENSIGAIVSVLYSVGNRGPAARDVNHSWHPFHFSPFISPFYPSDSSVQPLHLVAGELKEEGGEGKRLKKKEEERRNGKRAGGAVFIGERRSSISPTSPDVLFPAQPGIRLRGIFNLIKSATRLKRIREEGEMLRTDG